MGRAADVRRLCASAAAAIAVTLILAAPSGAALAPSESLTYIPFGFLHNQQSPELLDGTLASLNAYGIGQVLIPLPNFKANGAFKLSRTEQRMLALWVSRTASYNSAHASAMIATASIGGKVKGKSLNLEAPSVRANMLSGIETALGMGVGAISLDLEPYPQSHGFIVLLEEIDAAFARRGFTGRLSVAAPATAGRWSPAYMAAVTSLLGQVDPLFYDSERKTAASYEQWVREGLAYYSANTAAGTRIIPDLPSYGPNRWHDPTVENLATSTTAVEAALQEGSRVNGAGIFWWWGFFYNEEGEGSYNGAPDRETWLSRTLSVPFSP
jgi:hypothetical protein